VLANLEAVLRQAGVGPAQVVRTTVFLADLADFAKVNAIYAVTFNTAVAPARACVEVAALPKGARVEIDEFGEKREEEVGAGEADSHGGEGEEELGGGEGDGGADGDAGSGAPRRGAGQRHGRQSRAR
jgi:hypothetical protein